MLTVLKDIEQSDIILNSRARWTLYEANLVINLVNYLDYFRLARTAQPVKARHTFC